MASIYGQYAERRDAQLNRGKAVTETFGRLLALKDQLEQQKRQEAEQKATFVLDTTMKEVDDPLFWVNATPTKLGMALAKINSARNVLGLDLLDSLQDPRPEAFAGMVFETQKMLANGVGLNPDGTVSDLILLQFENTFGNDWMTGQWVDRHNQETIQGQGQPVTEGSALPFDQAQGRQGGQGSTRPSSSQAGQAGQGG